LPLLVLDFHVNIVDGVRGLDLEHNGFNLLVHIHLVLKDAFVILDEIILEHAKIRREIKKYKHAK
jgi:hypothetical protein